MYCLFLACVSAAEDDVKEDVTLEDDLGKSREASRTDDEAVSRSAEPRT